MYKQLLMIVTALALFGLAVGQASANSVAFLELNPIITTGPTLTLNLAGDFTDTTDGGAFAIFWDPTVLSYNGYSFATAFASSSMDDSTATTGLLTAYTIASPNPVTGLFGILSLSFDVIGGTGSFTNIDLVDAAGGWSDYNGPVGATLVVDYTSGQVVGTPLPAAAWLLISGMIGLVGITRRKNSA